MPQWLLAAVSLLKYAIPFSFQMVSKGVCVDRKRTLTSLLDAVSVKIYHYFLSIRLKVV